MEKEIATMLKGEHPKVFAANNLPPLTVNALLNERGKTHGDYAEHAAITQRIKRVFGDNHHIAKLNDMQVESLEMIAHKIGRILAGDPDFKDHWADIAGYATLVANRCSK